jgi:microcystin-dependent protein
MTQGQGFLFEIGANMKSGVMLLVSGLLLVQASQAVAQVPYTFSPGTPAKAAEVNANFVDLDGRVRTLGVRADSVDSRIGALTLRADSMDGSVGALTTRADSVDARVTAVTARTDSADLRINSLTARADSADGRIDSLAARADTVDGRVDSLMANLVPPGAVMAFAGTTAPPGWLLCDGSTVSRVTYAALFAVIGVSHGHGDLVNTFHLPDYQGRFLRGADRGRGRDPEAASRGPMGPGGATGDRVGSIQDDELASHNHPWNDPVHYHTVGADNSGGWNWGNVGSVSDRHAGDLPTGGSRSNITIYPAGGSETRPVNASVNYIIKY